MVNCYANNTFPAWSPNIYAILLIRHAGAPVFISNPHFYQSDPKFLKEVEGLEPQKDLHETYFKIQPVSWESGQGCQMRNLL